MAIRACKTIPILCFLLCFFLAAPLPNAEMTGATGENEILAIGTSTVAGGNLALAKNAAISRALMKGMESYLVNRLGSRGVVNNFQRLIQEIIPRAKENIENYHILAEDQIGDRYKVLVRLRINEKVLDERLREAGIVFMEGPPVKVLFLVSEKREESVSCWWKDPELNPPLGSAELALYNVFQQRGFIPLNRVLSLPEAEYTEDLRACELQDEYILKWGTLFSADMVMYGQANILEEKEVFVSLEVFDVRKGIRICQDMLAEPFVQGPEGGNQSIEAMERVAKLLAARMAPIMIRAAASVQEDISRFVITLKGLNSFKQFKIFRDFLRTEVSGVKSVRQTRVRKNSISMTVDFQGDRRRFLNRVLKHENLPFSVTLEETEDGGIVFMAM